MKKLMTALLLFVTTITVQAQDVITRNVGDFDVLKVFDKIEIKLQKGSENKVEISGINRRKVDIINKDGVLKVKMSLRNTWESSNTVVIVQYTSLSKIDVNEGASVRLKGTLEAEGLDLRAQEGGSIHAAIDTNQLLAKAVSGGALYLEGTAKNQEVNVQAGGQFKSELLKTVNTVVKISAGGKASVYASKYVKATTTAGGTVRIYGNPTEIDSKKTFGGKIIEMN